MNTKRKLFHARLVCAVALGIGLCFSLKATAADSADSAPAKTTIPWSQVGAKAGADYRGDGLAVIPTAEGAQLRCLFQRLEGEVTREGLWLNSTVTNAARDRFRVVAADVRRLSLNQNSEPGTRNEIQSLLTSAATDQGTLTRTGSVSIDGQTVRFTRPGLVEEYTVSMDGVRQDFIIEHPPLNPQLSTLNQRAGELAVWLAVSGAKVEPAAGGAQLVLENSGRRIAYSRLRVTDATGKELSARMEVLGGTGHWPVLSGDSPDGMSAATKSESAAPLLSDVIPVPLGGSPSGTGGSPVLPSREDRAPMLTVVVNDAEAVYPVRIDPTFSDANWIGLGGIPGADNWVFAAVVDGLGNLYIGGVFTIVGDVLANYIAKWNGSSWSPLGSGVDSVPSGHSGYSAVSAIAVSGSDVYVGGAFTTAGGSAATNIAKWNRGSWSALGSGMNLYGSVLALAVSGSNVYAGGWFTTAGGSAANYIAKWNGSSWSALGLGIGSGFPYSTYVSALAVVGSDVYAGGYFTTAGASAANSIAKWNGSSWSALGSGVNGGVSALAVSGSDMYAGGGFTTAGGKVSKYIARAYLPPLPTLSVIRSGPDLMVSWPSADTDGFTLEQVNTLAAPASWITSTATVTDDGSNKSVTLPGTNSPQFFRLSRP